MKTVAIIGATGMIGQELLPLLLQDPDIETVRVLVRRPYTKSHPKMEVKLVDFKDAESFKLALESTEQIFCCIGTTQKNVKGDKALYRQIDYDIPVNAARFGKEAGCKVYVIVTAVGANKNSGQFYLKLKGEVEDALEHSGIASVHIMQPSMLLGERTEKRPAEKILQGSMKFLSGLFVGSWRKFRAISGNTVAKAMLAASKSGKLGVFRYGYDEMNPKK